MASPASGAPTRAALIDLLGRLERPVHKHELADKLAIAPRHTRKLADLLEALAAERVIVPMTGQRFRLAQGSRAAREELAQGVLLMNPRGFGFVKASSPSADDWYVAPESLAGGMHGDLVSARVVARSSRGIEAEVVAVVERGRRRVAGVLGPRARYLEPDDARIRGPITITASGSPPDASGPEPMRALEPGLTAVVEITRYPELPDELPEGTVVAVLGLPGEPKVEVAKILAEHGVDESHPAGAVAEALAASATPRPDELEGREDLRGYALLTIDPEDARDFDDAVWAEELEHGGYRALIAVADVSHYVAAGTELDRSARMRGCSVYLPDRAVPMLPGRLASEVCSLLPHEDRLCLAVEVELDAEATVVRARVLEGVMRSAARLTYGAVARALGFSLAPERSDAAEEQRGLLGVLWSLASELRKRRMRRGALELDVPEARIALDPATGAPVAVTERAIDAGVRKAYRLVEELMLLANECVASEAERRDLPVIYRVHGVPDPEKMERFAAIATVLGMSFDPEDGADPKKLSRFLRKAEGHAKKSVLDGLLLRSLQQACYDTVNIGHFGLASRAYLHFTSPIRRYPDLVVHRLVRGLLRGERRPVDASAMQAAAALASERERNSMDVERQVADLYRAIYMKGRIGEEFEATVVAVGPMGLYARVRDPFVDVLVRMETLGMGTGADEFEPDDLGLALVGLRSGERIELGASLTIAVEDVSLVRRQIYARRLVTAAPERRGHGGHKRRTTRGAEPEPERERRGVRRGKQTTGARAPKGHTGGARPKKERGVAPRGAPKGGRRRG